jgi:peptide/nickel transport system permease protein
MALFHYIFRRILMSVVTLLSVATITFILSHHMGSNLVEAWLGKAAGLHPQLVELYTQKYHLDSSIWVQYYFYLLGVLQGNLGFSPSRGFLPVSSVIRQTLPYTLQLVIFAFVFTLILGVGLGLLSARHSHTPLDSAIKAFYLFGYASPPFFIALLLLVAFSFYLHALPSGGAADPFVSQPTPITGLPIFDSLLQGNWAYFFSSLRHVILPSLALALVTFGVITRVLRSSILETLGAYYIRTARAKGLDESRVFYVHALRNALIPVVSLLSITFTWLITGTVFVENVFAYPGMGQYLVGAILSSDYPGILAVTLIYAVVIVVGNLIVDILYTVVDPQIKLR